MLQELDRKRSQAEHLREHEDRRRVKYAPDWEVSKHRQISEESIWHRDPLAMAHNAHNV